MKWRKLTLIEGLVLSCFPKRLLHLLVRGLKLFDFIEETRKTHVPITFELWYEQQVMRHHPEVPWPVHLTSRVSCWKNIRCGVETSPGYMPGNYIQGYGGIEIGDYTQIGPNVGIISANHESTDTRLSSFKEVKIGSYCWLGFGSCILPGVTLGDHTVVAAGAVVTKSFPDGYCIIGGNPARLIKKLDPTQCIKYRSPKEYIGYLPKKVVSEGLRDD